MEVIPWLHEPPSNSKERGMYKYEMIKMTTRASNKSVVIILLFIALN